MSHAASDEEGEAGNLDSFGDLTEVTTNSVLEHLLENLCVSRVLHLSHRDLGCPVNPALPLQVQHNTLYHTSSDTCLFDLAVIFYQVIPLPCGFCSGLSPRTVCLIILLSVRKHQVLLHTFVKSATQPARPLSQ